MKKPILYIDMDNVLVDFKSAINRLSQEQLKEFEGRLDEVPGIFLLMDPIPGAIEAYHILSKEFDTYILSTSPWLNPTAASDKFTWVKTHLEKAAYKRLILSHHKHLNKGDFLIDDRLHNGAGEFNGELIQFGSDSFKNWVVVTQYLMSKKTGGYQLET